MKRFFSCLLALTISATGSLTAKEGMWIPMLLKQLNESEMQSMGLELSAEDIYSINHSSLKDAIVKFGGGCTGEIISSQGLLLTNHHCGYGQIQSHSSLENDYLQDGFWAMSKKEELPNPGLTATFIVRMEDVTDEVLQNAAAGVFGSDREKIKSENIKNVIAKATVGTHYEAEVKPFYNGNKYYLIVKEIFKDVRLVGAPPSSIGKFGFDTDNWMWPRHTGDFSMFRIYADKDNNPAEYSKKNVPYKPKHHLPISLKGTEPDDFTMVFGFPARTESYLPQPAVEYTVNQLNPARIGMRDLSLKVLAEEMDADRKVNIQYASKQSRISNAWKKWIGQNKGLINLNAVEMKAEFEKDFVNVAEKTGKQEWAQIPQLYKELYKDYTPLDFARAMLIEYYHYGPELFKFAGGFTPLLNENLEDDERTELIEKLLKRTTAHFKDYNVKTDRRLFEILTPQYLAGLQDPETPGELKKHFDGDKSGENLYDNSIFTNQAELEGLLKEFSAADIDKLKNDPAVQISANITGTYTGAVKPAYDSISAIIDSVDTEYMKAMMQLMSNSKQYYPDANFTLRLSYGKVEGYEPKDGMVYKHYTTIDGIMEKMDNSTKEYYVPQKLVDLHNQKDYGNYAGENGELTVCFTASNHTSGGNSGSPAINGKGELVGLNFDRTWESTMSDIMYDPNICRNIMVDIRYVLFITDKFAGAKHLVEEMTIVK